MPDTHSPSSHRTHVPFPAFMRPDPYLPAHDPAAVDFRAFYPYTPNEVKHRKRTTSSQLKILEDIFKRDTKPNAHLRNDLANQLDMTPRGVQVWFQNRRAKEKNKASKVSLSRALSRKGDDADDDDDDDSATPASPAVKDESADEPPAEGCESSASPPAIPSPPQLHVITDPVHHSWQDSPVEPPPDSAAFLTRPVRFSTGDLFPQRRGSLPANALFSSDTDSDPAVLDSFDPLARRRSVDASLQRLANNPYAHLARAKNGALFGPRFGVTPPGRHRSSLGRVPYAHNHHHHYPRPIISHHAASTPHSLDLRRSSMDARSLRFTSARGTASPSPSPLSPYHAIRASLPDQSLYAISSRTIASPIPGPLPSPHFSFGDASTPSMTSPSSGDSDRNSPDSIRSFPFRGDDRDEDDRTSASYDAFSSRFGSIASIATSDSSINSAYYSEIGGPGVEHDLGVDMHGGRRDSCTSGPFLGMMSGLDVTSPHLSMGDGALLSNSLGLAAYPSHIDDFTHIRTTGIQVIDHSEPRHESSAASYPSPASTISPGSGNGSPHTTIAANSAAGSSTNSPEGSTPSSSSPSNVPMSSSSELAFALHSKPDQEQLSQVQTQADASGQDHHQQLQQQQHLTYQGAGGEVPEQDGAYYYVDHAHAAGGMDGASGGYGEGYPASAAEADQSGMLSAQGHYVPTYGGIGEGYGAGDFHHGHQQQHQLNYGQCAPPGIVADVYAVPYADAGINPSMVSGMDSSSNHNGGASESFVGYS